MCDHDRPVGRAGLHDLERAPVRRAHLAGADDAVEQPGEAGVEVAAAELGHAAAALVVLADDARLAQDAEVVRGGRLADG